VKPPACERLRSWGAEIAIVLGSGLNALVDSISFEQRIAYCEFAELPPTKVAGHAGQFALGAIGDQQVIYAQGRAHLYEGHSAEAVTAGVRLLAACGIKRLILTNAAGSANAKFHPGSWMMICDQLNLTGTTPLFGSAQFIDMSDVYSHERRAAFAQLASQQAITLHEGIYAGVLGPQYETPAEVQMLRRLGADAIGMSTVLEAIQARALGLEVSGFSCLTNWAAGIREELLSHEEVLATAKAAAADFARLLEASLR
jgi:purine-nucleoside phosphorylase